MQQLPLFADIRNRPCLVVGGGVVAGRRVKLLLEAGAEITVLTTEASDTLQRLADDGQISLELDSFVDQPLEPYWLVIAATDDRTTNRRVADAAKAAQRFCNVVDDPDHCTFIMPAIVDRDPVTVAISTAGFSPVLARWTKGVIETVLPNRLGSLATLARNWRERVKERLADGDSRRRFWQAVMDSDVAEHAFAGRDPESEAALQHLLHRWVSGAMAPTSTGEAYLVGAGPGGDDLITLRGRELLARADTVLYDRLVNPQILSYARREAEILCVGKAPDRQSIKQSEINDLLVELVRSGQKVCRLKGGDPMVFGRAGEELEALVREGLRFQIVPGVSAIEGCAAYAGIPLTLRGSARSVLLATGRTEGGAAADLSGVRKDQTLALYMGVARYGDIAQELIEHGLAPSTPAAVIENGTTDAQRVIRTTLSKLRSACETHAVRPPALLIVGEATLRAESYAWFSPVIRADVEISESTENRQSDALPRAG